MSASFPIFPTSTSAVNCPKCYQIAHPSHLMQIAPSAIGGGSRPLENVTMPRIETQHIWTQIKTDQKSSEFRVRRSEVKLQLALPLRLCDFAGAPYRFMDQNRTEIARFIKYVDFCSGVFRLIARATEQKWAKSTRNRKNADVCSHVFTSRASACEQKWANIHAF